ncbi:MAG: carbohydrate ABC transporter permease, partial [Oscillospiraceae bacterium]|nr:carbohydrate ABC transporter permease [Oscillospiraceae bacterium]
PPRMYVVNPTLQNFADLFNLLGTSWVPFSRYLFNTILLTVLGTAGQLFFGSMAAYVFSRVPIPGKKIMFWFVFKSLMFHAVATGLIVFIMMSFLGLIDTFAAIVVPVWGATLGVFLMKQFMDANVSETVIEAARIDGAGEIRTFSKIVMPMAKPALYTAILFSFQGLWNQGASIFIYSEQLKTLNYAIGQILAVGVLRQGAAMAASVVMLVVPVIVFVISQSKVIETMSSSGVKE